MEQIIKGFVDDTVKGLTEIIDVYSGSLPNIDKKEIERVFFIMHSLTGSSAMFGFSSVSAFSVYVERVYDQLRKGNIKINPEIMEYTVRIALVIKQIVKAEPIDSNSTELIEFFKNQLPK